MKNLTITEYQNQRILTTSQLAESYETTDRRISENFNANRDRYQEGKHFYCLENESLSQFKNEYGNSVIAANVNKLYLWTEKGTLLHAKSLGTDKAWEVYEMLIETYFKVQQTFKQVSQAELTAMIAQNQVEIERTANTALEVANKASRQIANALDIFTAPVADTWRHDTNEKINKICLENGLSYLVFKHEMYSELENVAKVNLKARQLYLRQRMKKGGSTYAECKAISKLDIVERDPKLKSIFEGIVRKYQAKYASMSCATLVPDSGYIE